MLLSDAHLKTIREIATENGWRYTRAMRNVVFLNATEGDFQLRVQIRRNDLGDCKVEGTIGCVFNGTMPDFVLFMNQCLAQSNKTAKMCLLMQEYLGKEVRSCSAFEIDHLEAMGRLIFDFPGWIDPLSKITASDRGITAVDPIVNGMFSGAENIDLALQGGRLEVDSEPGNHATVWVSRDYLYPLAKQLTDYLSTKGFTSSISTAEVFIDEISG
jgi:hypothetical protein